MKSYSLLIVDPEKSFTTELRAFLQKRFTCEDIYEAGDGSQAWDAIHSQKLDAVICSKDIPGISGLQLLLKLKESENHIKLPVLMIFDQEDKEAMGTAIHLGVSELIAKPFGAYEFVQKLRRMLSLKERRTAERCYDILKEPVHGIIQPDRFINSDFFTSSGRFR